MVDLFEALVLEREQRPSGDDRETGALAAFDHLASGGLLHGHAPHQGQVRPAQVPVRHGLEVQVDQPETPRLGKERGDGQQSERGEERVPVREREGVLEAPERVGEFRIEEERVHGEGTAARRSGSRAGSRASPSRARRGRTSSRDRPLGRPPQAGEYSSVTSDVCFMLLPVSLDRRRGCSPPLRDHPLRTSRRCLSGSPLVEVWGVSPGRGVAHASGQRDRGPGPLLRRSRLRSGLGYFEPAGPPVTRSSHACRLPVSQRSPGYRRSAR